MNTTTTNSVLRQPPYRKGSSLILGSGLDFWRAPIPLMDDLLKNYPDLVRVRLGFDSVHFVFSPDLAKPVLQQTNKNYVGFPAVVRSIKSVGGENLFTSQGENWRNQRKMLQPAFHKRAVFGFGPIMVEEANRVIESWKSNPGPLPIAEIMQDITFNIFARSLFSTNLAGEHALRADYANGANYITYRIENPLAPPLFIPTPGNLKIRSAVTRTTQHIKAIIDQRRADSQGKEDFLQMLIESKYDDGAALEETLILNQAKMFLFGGNGPPSKIITWTLYFLSKYPEVEAKLHEELDRELGGKTPTLDDLPKLTYLQMVIDELLRLYPTAWGLPRLCVEGDDLGGYDIPKGAGVWVLLYNMHRHPDFWERPYDFDPERFTTENTAKRPPHAYMPWGAGPRMCIANQISMFQMKLVLAIVCQQYRLTCPADYIVRPKIGFPLGPEGPVMMTPVKR